MATKREIWEKEQYMLSIETPIYKVLGLDRERNACSKLKYYLIQCKNTCNIMKNTLPKDVFLNKIAQIYNYSLNNKKQMEKRISFFEFQNVLSVAKLIDPYVRKKQEAETQFNKLMEQAKKLKAQIDVEAAVIQANQKEIDSYESGIVSVLGFHATDLVKKVMVPTGKTSQKTGKPTMEANYLPTSIVTYDEANKQYIVNTGEEVSEELVKEAQEEVTEAVEEAPTESTEWA